MDKTCANCETRSKAKKAGDKHEPVPFWVFEEVEARNAMEQKKLLSIIKWLIAVIILLIVAFVGSNLAWAIYESSFEDVITTEEIILDAEDNGNVNYIGQDGNIYNGEDKDNQEN